AQGNRRAEDRQSLFVGVLVVFAVGRRGRLHGFRFAVLTLFDVGATEAKLRVLVEHLLLLHPPGVGGVARVVRLLRGLRGKQIAGVVGGDLRARVIVRRGARLRRLLLILKHARDNALPIGLVEQLVGEFELSRRQRAIGGD